MKRRFLSNSEYRASTERLKGKLIGKDVKGNGRGLI
jgi:hypothetical protein